MAESELAQTPDPWHPCGLDVTVWRSPEQSGDQHVVTALTKKGARLMPFCDPIHHLHAVMAGNGNPYDVLTPLRLRLLRALHSGLDFTGVATTTGLDQERLAAELQPLLDAHLATEVDGRIRPTFLIATAQETDRVDAHAALLGQQLAQRLLERREEITQAFGQLTVSSTTALRDFAFVLVGDRILDVGLLDALARETTLMPPAPARPSPTNPDARYYFWMIEGEHDQLGRYGQRVTTLPWDNWMLLTFGQYTIGDRPNAERDGLETAALAYLAEDSTLTPSELARFLDIPIIDQADAANWWTFVRGCADDLLSVYRDARSSLLELYTTLGASTYLTHGFGEFFCWYDHLAYAHAIDALATHGMLTIPPQRFAAAVWQEIPQATSF